MSKRLYNVLIVEDEATLRKVYQVKLELAGHNVQTASNGEEGVQKAFEMVPDLILLDIRMPKMDGFEVLKRIRENPSTTNARVIVFSNLGQKDDVDKALALGADDYLIKSSFTPAAILEKIDAQLEDTQNPVVLESYKLAFDPSAYDATKLARAFKFPTLFTNAAGKKMMLELLPDLNHQEKGWFLAHFIDSDEDAR